MAATPDELVAPPQEVPGVYTDAVAKLHKTARNLMVLKGIPWFIQATLSDEGFVSMEDLATRWDSPDRAGERGEPKTRHQLERMHAVFRNTLLMSLVPAVWPVRHHPGGPGELVRVVLW